MAAGRDLPIPAYRRDATDDVREMRNMFDGVLDYLINNGTIPYKNEVEEHNWRHALRARVNKIATRAAYRNRSVKYGDETPLQSLLAETAESVADIMPRYLDGRLNNIDRRGAITVSRPKYMGQQRPVNKLFE